MWRTLVFVAIYGCGSAIAFAAAPIALTPESRLAAEAQAQQQARIEALARRGRLDNYQKLLGAGRVRVDGLATDVTGRSIPLTTAQLDAMSREAAINLAALGFTASDVAAYRRKNVDLFDVVHRLHSGRSSSAEQMLMADIVVIATAGEVMDGRTRLDGFLSATPFTVEKSLKGSRATGDIIYIPRKSGVTPEGLLTVTSDIAATPGKKYLLVLSRNAYEQSLAQNKKQNEIGFNASPYLVYEVAGNGALLDGPRPTLSGFNPKSLTSAEDDLKKFSLNKN